MCNSHLLSLSTIGNHFYDISCMSLACLGSKNDRQRKYAIQKANEIYVKDISNIGFG